VDLPMFCLGEFREKRSPLALPKATAPGAENAEKKEKRESNYKQYVELNDT
jgi:hypothetical protein